MSNRDHSPESNGGGLTVPDMNGLLTIRHLWADQLSMLQRCGVLDQAIGWAEHDNYRIDADRSHVFIETNPTTLPWDSDGTAEVPDTLLAFNGLLLSGTRLTDHGVDERHMLAVYIGMYFGREAPADKWSLVFNQGDLMEPPNTVVGGFDEQYAEEIHGLAQTMQLETDMFNLPLDARLSLPPSMMDMAFTLDLNRPDIIPKT